MNGGSTAADLGLAGIDVAAGQAAGTNLVSLYDSLDVTQLNDGSGLSIRDELADLEVQFRDGTPWKLTCNAVTSPTSATCSTVLNAADPARLSAAIGSDG